MAVRLLCHWDEWAQHYEINPHINLIFHSVPLHTGLSDLSFLFCPFCPCRVYSLPLTHHLAVPPSSQFFPRWFLEPLRDSKICLDHEKMRSWERLTGIEKKQDEGPAQMFINNIYSSRFEMWKVPGLNRVTGPVCVFADMQASALFRCSVHWAQVLRLPQEKVGHCLRGPMMCECNKGFRVPFAQWATKMQWHQRKRQLCTFLLIGIRMT